MGYMANTAPLENYYARCERGDALAEEAHKRLKESFIDAAVTQGTVADLPTSYTNGRIGYTPFPEVFAEYVSNASIEDDLDEPALIVGACAAGDVRGAQLRAMALICRAAEWYATSYSEELKGMVEKDLQGDAEYQGGY
jgi:hypothetical protein